MMKRAVARIQTALQKKNGMVMSAMIRLQIRMLSLRPMTRMGFEKREPTMRPKMDSETRKVSLNSTLS